MAEAEVVTAMELVATPGASADSATYVDLQTIFGATVLTITAEEEELQEVVEEEELLGSLTLCSMLAMVEEEDTAILEAESTNTSISTMH